MNILNKNQGTKIPFKFKDPMNGNEDHVNGNMRKNVQKRQNAYRSMKHFGKRKEKISTVYENGKVV